MVLKKYNSKEDWLNSPKIEDRVELYFGIYITSKNKIKSFVFQEKENIPQDYINIETDIITIEKANKLAEQMLENINTYYKKINEIKNRKRIKTYYYGVVKKQSEFITFVCKTEAKIPLNANVVKCGQMVVELATKLAKELAEELKYLMLYDFDCGDIIVHADQEGQHTAIVLLKGIKYSALLFVTSNPYWNKKSRLVTEEENILLGYPLKDTISYFAPVIRNNKYIIKTEKKYPNYRINELIKEFKVEING